MSGIEFFHGSQRTRRLLQAITLALIAAWSAPAGAQAIWYVDANATGPQTGTSWSTAFRNLDIALVVAVGGDEVWVADGTYRPQNPSTPSDPRSATFQVPSGIRLYGGFAGDETSVAERLGLFESTILSGDIGVPNDSSDNAYHVATLYAPTPVGTPPTYIDGFLVAHGHANGAIGPDRSGAGIWSFGNKPRLANCVFRFNDASVASALMVTSGSLGVAQCTFEFNTASDGAGALMVQTAYGIVYNSTFRGNAAANYGGAVVLARQLGTSRVLFMNCLFHDNRATHGGAAFLEGDAGPGQVGQGRGVWTNCTFAFNLATGSGGGLHAATGPGGSAVSTIQNSIVWNNRASSFPQIFGPHTVRYSDVQGSGGGVPGNIDSDPLFINRDGSPRNLRFENESPAIDAAEDVPLWVDAFDFDGDGDTTEPVSLDLDFGVRIAGAGLDMGAYEH